MKTMVYGLSAVRAFWCRHFHEGILNVVMKCRSYSYDCAVCKSHVAGEW